jgi:biopolymer transport protein TolQ
MFLFLAAAEVVTQTMSFSPIALFWHASLPIKLIAIGLVLSSIWSWTIIIHKTLSFWRANRKLDIFEERFWSGNTLDQLYDLVKHDENHPCAEIFMSGMQEWKYAVSSKILPQASKKVLDRMEIIMKSTLNRELDDMKKHMGFLAMLGSNGVIIGLLGTVLGIMSSFQSIAQNQNAGFAAIGPSMTEALFVTAIGLMASIPAALFYNRFMVMNQSYSVRLDDFIQNFIVVMSRQLDND